MIRALVLDFDGVVLESADIKTRAFAELFGHLPEHVDAIVAYHLANAGLSRFEKFEWVYRELLGSELSPSTRAELGDRFSDLALDSVLRCAFVPGARELLDTLAGRVPVYVASGTPHEELLAIIAARGIDGHVTGVWGSPTPKEDALREILERESARPDEVLFVGDGESDHRAAVAVGVRFVARATPSTQADWQARQVATVEDLRELLGQLRPLGSAAS